jgi:hypothetical protein
MRRASGSTPPRRRDALLRDAASDGGKMGGFKYQTCGFVLDQKLIYLDLR